LILAAGAALRYAALVESVESPLDPDAQGYRLYAHHMSLFSKTGFFSAQFGIREPMFILVVRAVYKLIGESDYHLRLVSFILSIIVIWVVSRIGREMFGHGIGWMIGLLVAMNRPLIGESTRGLRLELEMIVLLVYLFCAFIWRRPEGIRKALMLGGVGGILVLVRSTHLPALMPLQALASYEKGRPKGVWLRNTAISMLIMIALVVPHRYNLYRIHGDPFWEMTQYARWNANMEFAGKSGFPTREQLSIDTYVGPRITYWQYMFGMHTVGEILSGTARGYSKLFRKMGECVNGEGWLWWPCAVVDSSIGILGLAGFALACFRRTYVWLPLAFMLVEFPPAFLYDRNLAEAYRLTFIGFPIVLFAAALAVKSGISAAGSYAQLRRRGGTKDIGKYRSRTGSLSS
jgi:4-amino-4-deoxy-L-arabinose transferase-like glycosyltransferase